MCIRAAVPQADMVHFREKVALKTSNKNQKLLIAAHSCSPLPITAISVSSSLIFREYVQDFRIDQVSGLKHKPCPSVSDLPATGNGNWLLVARNPLRWLPQAIQQRRQERLVTSQLGYATTDAQNQASSY